MSALPEELWRALMAGFVEIVAMLDEPPTSRLAPLHLSGAPSDDWAAPKEA